MGTGDVGRFDEDGFLYITGRIKELLITAGGENIPPVVIERKMKEEMPAVSQFVVIGDKRKFLSALVTLKVEQDAEGLPTSTLASPATTVNPQVTTVEQAINDPVWRKYIEDGIKRGNARADSNAQKIQKFRILPEDFTHIGVDAVLGPTLKLMRRKVMLRYAAEVESMYAGGGGD
eukprot:NODE_2357_length_620_cov_84.429072_g2003_i0.p1 GENE.NODE_2357_length_620_cov_84.429072_g2003_i0~~NODE_2357_length_620_cov_84.429072_g2003_i0.p1  ORF type:complete len:183 (+),score=97.52 NODE_2357_length_620_cov_84.429072_g2003_i0:23-550(+)